MIIIPELITRKILITLIEFYYNNYKTINQAKVEGFVNLVNGFNFSLFPQSMRINGTEILMNTNCTTLKIIVDTLNALLVSNNIKDCLFYSLSDKFVCLKTVSKKVDVQSLQIQNPVTGVSLLNTLGFREQIYLGFDHTYTYLYKIFENLQYDNYNFLNEIVNVLNNTFDKVQNKDARKLRFWTDWNINPDKKPPFVTITLADDSSDQNMLGRTNTSTIGDTTETRTRTFTASLKFTIVSNNKNETVLLYHFLKCIIEANTSYFNYNEIKNVIVVGGGDTLSELDAPDMFSTMLTMKFTYANKVPTIIDKSAPVESLNWSLTNLGI